MKKKNYKIKKIETEDRFYYFYEMEWNLYGKRERFYAPTEEELWEKLQHTEDERLKYLMTSFPENNVLNDYINFYFKGQLCIGNPIEMKSDLLFIRTITSGSEIDRNITELSAEDIQSYYNKLTALHSSEEIIRLHEIFTEIFQSFNHIGIKTPDLNSIQIPDIKKVKNKYERILLSENEMETLMIQCLGSRNSNNAFVVIFALHTGIYLNDIFEIRNHDIQLDDSAVNVKGKTVPICPECLEWLKERLADKAGESDILYKNPEQKENIIRNYLKNNSEGYLFTNARGKKTTFYPAANFLKNIAEKSGISRSITPLSLHCSYLADAIKNGADIEELKTLYGHDDKFYKSLIKK
ncbi:MAG: tyrosine-type recombinase/integrase [Ruminococcus sp.]|nr:tyrosine-type recombinase/integrase [Ruminococcus sp.]